MVAAAIKWWRPLAGSSTYAESFGKHGLSEKVWEHPEHCCSLWKTETPPKFAWMVTRGWVHGPVFRKWGKSDTYGRETHCWRRFDQNEWDCDQSTDNLVKNTVLKLRPQHNPACNILQTLPSISRECIPLYNSRMVTWTREPSHSATWREWMAVVSPLTSEGKSLRRAYLVVRDGVEHLADLRWLVDFLLSTRQWVRGRQGIHGKHFVQIVEDESVFLQQRTSQKIFFLLSYFICVCVCMFILYVDVRIHAAVWQSPKVHSQGSRRARHSRLQDTPRMTQSLRSATGRSTTSLSPGCQTTTDRKRVFPWSIHMFGPCCSLSPKMKSSAPQTLTSFIKMSGFKINMCAKRG